MITPFHDDNTVNYEAVKNITEWYIANGCDGIFAVCQSSEMFFLSEQEKIDIARAVIDAAAGRVPVVASGHTADDFSKQIDELGSMAETGVDAVIMVSNRLARYSHWRLTKTNPEFLNQSNSGGTHLLLQKQFKLIVDPFVAPQAGGFFKRKNPAAFIVCYVV